MFIGEKKQTSMNKGNIIFINHDVEDVYQIVHGIFNQYGKNTGPSGYFEISDDNTLRFNPLRKEIIYNVNIIIRGFNSNLTEIELVNLKNNGMQALKLFKQIEEQLRIWDNKMVADIDDDIKRFNEFFISNILNYTITKDDLIPVGNEYILPKIVVKLRENKTYNFGTKTDIFGIIMERANDLINAKYNFNKKLFKIRDKNIPDIIIKEKVQNDVQEIIMGLNVFSETYLIRRNINARPVEKRDVLDLVHFSTDFDRINSPKIAFKIKDDKFAIDDILKESLGIKENGNEMTRLLYIDIQDKIIKEYKEYMIKGYFKWFHENYNNMGSDLETNFNNYLSTIGKLNLYEKIYHHIDEWVVETGFYRGIIVDWENNVKRGADENDFTK